MALKSQAYRFIKYLHMLSWDIQMIIDYVSSENISRYELPLDELRDRGYSIKSMVQTE